jgi:hypothetical protein
MKNRDSDTAFPVDMAFLLVPFLVAISSIIVDLLGGLWIAAYAGAISIVAFGGTLIFKAKLPVYRDRRFLTFGVRALPDSSIPLYQRGWKCVFVGTVLAGFLLVTRG